MCLIDLGSVDMLAEFPFVSMLLFKKLHTKRRPKICDPSPRLYKFSCSTHQSLTTGGGGYSQS